MSRLIRLALLAVAFLAGRGRADEPPAAAEEGGLPASVAGPVGKPVLVLDAGGHTAKVWQALFTPDGKQVISVSQDKTIRIWDVESGQTRRVLRPPIGSGVEGELYAVALSPDGRTLAAAGHGLEGWRKTGVGIYLIDLAGGKMRTLKGHKDNIYALAFAPDGKRLASAGHDKTVRIWDVDSGECERTLVGHQGKVVAVTFCPTRGSLLASGGFDKTVRLWDLATGKETAPLRHLGEVWSLAWSPDGKKLVSSGWNFGLAVWDADGTPRPGIDLPLPLQGVDGLAFLDPQGLKVLAAGKRWNQGVVEYGATWVDLATGKAAGTLVLGRSIQNPRLQLAYHPERRLAVTCGGDDNEVILWRPADGKVVHRMRGRGQAVQNAHWGKLQDAVAWSVPKKAGERERQLSLAFRPSDLLLSWKPDPADYFGVLHRLGTLSVVQRNTTNTLEIRRKDQLLRTLGGFPHWVESFTLMPGERVAVAGNFGVRVHSIPTGKVLDTFESYAGMVGSIAPSPDGRYLVSMYQDQTIRILEPGQRKPLLSLFVARNEWVAWTPEGYYAASAGGERLMGWQINNGPDRLASFYPAAQFRSSLFRPDVIQRLLAEGSVAAAVKVADEARGRKEVAAVEVEEVLPPEVTLAAPGLAGPRLTRPAVEVRAEARGVGKHPVTALQLLLDGRPYGGAAGLRRVAGKKPGEAVAEKWTVAVPPGEHSLRVLARSAVSFGLSNDVEVAFAELPARPRLYVLAVGIDAYKDRNLELKCAVNDAAGLVATFQKKSEAIFDVRTDLLTDPRATKKGILAGFARLKEMRDTDTAVIFFAGHGERDARGQFYLLPQDVKVDRLAETAISAEVLRQHLAALPGRVLLLLDACHSGAVGRVINEMARELGDEDSGVVAMCAATPKERAGESQKDGHGFFCLALLEALGGKGARSPRDGCVYIHHLGQYVYDRVQELSNDEQHPTTPQPGIKPFRLARP
jgi:WD40 repeat protein